MSASFPDINLDNLKKFAADEITPEYPTRSPIKGSKGSKAVARPKPRVLSAEDVVWGGMKTILLTFDPATVPLGPRSMLIYFPFGRPKLKTQTFVGMSSAARRKDPALAPKVHGYLDYADNRSGTEVVLLEKIPGDSLEDMWPLLSEDQQEIVCCKVADLLLQLFNCRGSLICTERQGLLFIDTKCDSPEHLANPTVLPDSVLVGPSFDIKPLTALPPPDAVLTVEQYLGALAGRIDRVFNHGDAGIIKAARSPDDSDDTFLTDRNVRDLKDTWYRAASLITYHCGGFYIPSNLKADTRKKISQVLRSQQYGIYHRDMQMCRFVVQFGSGRDEDIDTAHSASDITVTLATGWEAASRLPLWSCARLPPWLTAPTSLVSPERQRQLRKVFYDYVTSPPQRQHFRDWVFAYLYGVPERWFQHWIGMHWRDYKEVEIGLWRLKLFWEIRRPDIPFPLQVPMFLLPHEVNEAGEEEVCNHIKALARASGTNADHWELASYEID